MNPADFAAAREQMEITLGFHIVLASIGIGLPALTLLAEWRSQRTGDPAYAALAHRWAKATGVLFAVGAVSGTVLSFEFGTLRPRFMSVGLLALPGAALLGVRSPLLLISAASGLVSLALLWRRAYVAVRVSAALAVGAVLWGAADLAQLNLDASAAQDTVLQAVFIALGAGAVILLPSLAWLYILFQREPRHQGP
jgi:cytochrome bd-type quinol oxidase subunit 2